MQEEPQKWKDATDAEYNMLVQLGTWTPSPLPPGRHAIQTKWVYKRKWADGGYNLYKARLVAKGFVQQPHVVYGDTYAPSCSSLSPGSGSGPSTRAVAV